MIVVPPVPALRRAFDVEVLVGPPVDHGVTSAGHRRVVPILGGSISGDLTATIEAGGADWQIVRDEGTIEIDGRYTARTDDGDLVYLKVAGIRSGSADVLQALLSGAVVDPGDYYFRTFVSVESSARELDWMQKSLFVASCVREADRVRYVAYAVT
ncbi:MAG: DUF3237 domain-containing protein [Microbacterium sp.]